MKKIVFITLCLLCCDVIVAQTYTLQQLNDSALRHNNAIRAAQLDIDAARQQRREAFTKYFPNISAAGFWFNTNKGMAQMEIDPADFRNTPNAAFLNTITPEMMTMVQTAAQTYLPADMLAALGSVANPIGITMMKNGAVASVSAVQPVFAGGQIVNGNRLAKVGEDVGRLKLQLSENEVERTTTKYFWQLVSLQEKLRTLDAVDALLADIAKDVNVAVSAGVALRNDLLQVQLRQNDIQSQRLKLLNGMQVLKLTLAQYCSLSDTTFTLAPVDASLQVAMPSHDEGQLAALPEYQLLEKQVEATRLQRRMEVGKNLPSIGVGAGYNYHNLLDRSFLDSSKGKVNHAFGMIFATVSVPLSDWWGGAHAIKRRQIEQRKAQEQLQDASELLKIRMQKAWNDVQEAYQQTLLARQGMEQASENLRLNRNYYKAGTCTMGDLLQAQLLYQQAMDKRTDAFADYQNRLLDYKQAVGQR